MSQVLLLALALLQAPGTTLSGVVTHSGDGQPLAGALVVIDELRIETRTAADGAYRFDNLPPGRYHVGVRADGYSTRRTEVRIATSPQTLNLSIDFELHFTEVLSVSPTMRPQFESYEPTTVLDGAELTKTLEPTIGATLSALPGIAMREFGSAPARPVIRGLDGDRISVLEDGQRMGDLSSQSGDHAVPTNPASARRIEVVRGPATLLYGANAIGGLVNVVIDAVPSRRIDHATGTVTFNAGSNGAVATGAADVHAGNGTFAVHAAAAGTRAGNYHTPDGEVANSQTRMAIGQIGVSRTFEKSYIGGSYGYDDSDYGIPVVSDSRLTLTPKRHSINVRAGGQDLSGWVQSYRATLGIRNYEHSERAGDRVNATFHNDTLEGELLVSHRRSGGVLGSVGGWVLNRHFKPITTELLSPPVDQAALAAFVYEEVEASHATLQFGGRFDHSRFTPPARRERIFNEWSGSGGVLLRPLPAGDDVVVAINLARAARYPSLEELYYFGPHPGNMAFELGNDALYAEHALGFDVSLRGRHQRAEGEVTFFHNDINRYIFRQPTGEVVDGLIVVRNIEDDSVLQGVEAQGVIRLSGEWTVEASYDWVKGDLKDPREPLPRIPPQRVLAGIAYQKNAFQAGGGAQLVSAQDRVSGAETPTAGYTTIKFFCSYSFHTGAVLNTVTARLDNAADERYRNHLNYLKDVLLEQGRSFKVVYGLEF